jgi:membrane-associated phospholipid phosphatase
VPAVKAFDDRVDSMLSPLRGRRAADRTAYLASELADFSVGWHLANAAIALARPRTEVHAVRMAVALGVESALVNGVIKPLFRRDRPASWEDVASLQVRRPKTASFPSGHASSATLAALLLSETVPGLRVLWWSAAAVVCTSRVHTRMHHASDVAAGVMVGAAIGLVTTRIAPLPRGIRPRRR